MDDWWPGDCALSEGFQQKEEESEAEKRHHEDIDEKKFRKDV
jgi:hypothetical protein